MKQRTLVFVLSLLFVGLAQAASVVTMVEDPWPPYVIVDEAKNEITGGIAVDIIKKVFERIPEVQIKFVIRPWKRALAEVGEGKFDGIIIFTKTPDREQVFDYPDHMFTGRVVLFSSPKHQPDGIQWNELKDLEKYKIGTMSGYSSTEKLRELAKEKGINLDIKEVTTEQQVFQMLMAGRVDAVMANESVGYALLKQFDWQDQVVITDKSLLPERKYYMGFSKISDAGKYIPQINKILAEMKANGTIDKLVKGN